MQPDPTREEIERLTEPRTYTHNGSTHPISYPHLSDVAMANLVQMPMRDDWMHEAVVVGARDRILHLSERLASEPDRIAAARAEGIGEGREGVLREIREAGVRLSEASMDEAATAVAARVAPMLASARAAGFREGVEAAAVWMDHKAASCEALGAKVLAGDYLHIAALLRSLIPSPAPVETSAPVADELAERLRSTTEEMANRASVPMDLWGRHSNACLDAVARIAALEAEITALRERETKLVEHLRPFTDDFNVFTDQASDTDRVYVTDEDIEETADSGFTVGDIRRARALVYPGEDIY